MVWLLLACAFRQPPETGLASWYGPGFRGNTTASGESFRPGLRRTAAHPDLPFGTVVEVTRMGGFKEIKILETQEEAERYGAPPLTRSGS